VLCDVAGRVGASLLVLGARGRGRAGGQGGAVGAVATRVLLRATGVVRIVRGSSR
jgi:nucleotide-binding universal stress UspA family protein